MWWCTQSTVAWYTGKLTQTQDRTNVQSSNLWSTALCLIAAAIPSCVQCSITVCCLAYPARAHHGLSVKVNYACYCWLCRAALLLIALKAPCADLSLARQHHAHIAGQGKNKGNSHAHTQQHTLEACIAALLFAAHPIHTEAVAGIVGHAELLSAALALLALMAYMSAASKADWGKHYRMLAVSMLMLFLAALAKEIGITMVQHSPLSISVCSVVPACILCHTYAHMLGCAVVLATLHRASQLSRPLTPAVP